MKSTSRPASRPRRFGIPLALVAVALLATSCDRVPVRTFDKTSAPRLALHYLSRDGTDRIVAGAGNGWFVASAPSTNRAHNTRALIYPPGTQPAVDQQVCSTWSDQRGSSVQQGLAMRVRHDIDGRWRAVTVMKNILWGASWNFNVLTWDSNDPQMWRMHGYVSLPTVFRTTRDLPAPLPWRVCARVEGDLVTMKAWRTTEAEPKWGDSSHGGSVRLPAGWSFAGKAGWYVGHLDSKGSTRFDGLTIDNLVIKTSPTPS